MIRALLEKQPAPNSRAGKGLADEGKVIASPKILGLGEVERLVRAAQAAGRRVVLCHGCFDLVHPGHIRHLQEAARLGDHLLVTVTGDAVIYKGAGRPFIPQSLRAENLAALDCVEWVAINPAATAVELLRRVRPDVYVKGREYEENQDPRFATEKAVVAEQGGRLVFTSGEVVFSSTALIEAMGRAVDPVHHRLRHLMDHLDLDEPEIDALLRSFRGCRILVIGEVIRDTYVMCDQPEVSTEGPMMTLRPLESRSFDGGAAIVAAHLAALGAIPVLLTALPEHPGTRPLRERLARSGIELRSLATSSELVEKKRLLVGTTKVIKLETGSSAHLDTAGQESLLRQAKEEAHGCDAAIVADFGLGMLSRQLMIALCRTLRPMVGTLSGDVSGRRSNLLAMQDMDLLCPSESEIRDALHEFDDGLSAVAWRLLHETNARSTIVTLGREGAIAFQRPDDIVLEKDDWETRLSAQHIPALTPLVIDPLGCGDAMLAGATLTLATDRPLTLAAVVGAIAAALEGQSFGNTPVSTRDLERGLREVAGLTNPGFDQPRHHGLDQLHLAHP